MEKHIWLLQLCQDPENRPFEMTVLGVFEDVSDTDLIGWEKTSSTDIWVKTGSEGEYFFHKLLVQPNPSWMKICS